MKLLQSLVTIAVVASSVLGAPPKPGGSSSISTINPYKDHEFFLSPQYRPKVLNAAKTFLKQGKWELAAKAGKIAATISTFAWIDKIEHVPDLEDWLKEASLLQKVTRKDYVVQIEVYNLPDRDCSAKASAGELILAQDGARKYKEQFIKPIAKILKKYPKIRVVLGLETDAVGNLVTNLAVPKCAGAATAHKELMAWAIAELQLPNVAIYLDGAHAGWLGWESNIGGAADILAGLLTDAKKINPKSTVRGVATNVSNYNGIGDNGQQGRDELAYIRNLAPLLSARGFDAHFIIDQGRSGNQTAPREGGDWCNFSSAGFGTRPTSKTVDPLIDAVVWVKPGGEADGTSDETAERYDVACGAPTSLKPAPEAGTWFQAYFEQLIVRANPPI